MKALILAGGKGTRLRPYTTVLPKPLMPVGDFPILEIILRQLKGAGVTEVVLAVGYMSQLFQAFFQDGERLGIKLTYAFEDKALGTAGPIANVIESLGEDFIVMNGDLLTTLDFAALFEWHRAEGGADARVVRDHRFAAVHERQDPFGEIADRDALALPEIDDLADRGGDLARAHKSPDRVLDVGQVADRIKRAEANLGLLERLADNGRNHGARRLSGPESVEGPHRADRGRE